MDRRTMTMCLLTATAGIQACGGGGDSSSQTAPETTATVQAMRAAQQDTFLADANALTAQYAAQGRRSSTYLGVSDLFVTSIAAFLQRAYNYVITRPTSDRSAVSTILSDLKLQDKNYINTRVTASNPLSATQLADFISNLNSRIDTTYAASGLM